MINIAALCDVSLQHLAALAAPYPLVVLGMFLSIKKLSEFNCYVLYLLGPGRPSAGGPRWDRRSNTLTHASLRACGAQLGGIVWKQGK